MAWAFLLLAAVFEVGFTTCLRLADGFRNIPWSVGFGVCAFLSFTFLDMAQRTIPLGLAYAVWVGIGAAGTAIIGQYFFAERLGALPLLMIAGIVACVVGLKLTSGH